jgi:hypothetical protein
MKFIIISDLLAPKQNVTIPLYSRVFVVISYDISPHKKKYKMFLMGNLEHKDVTKLSYELPMCLSFHALYNNLRGLGSKEENEYEENIF